MVNECRFSLSFMAHFFVPFKEDGVLLLFSGNGWNVDSLLIWHKYWFLQTPDVLFILTVYKRCVSTGRQGKCFCTFVENRLCIYLYLFEDLHFYLSSMLCNHTIWEFVKQCYLYAYYFLETLWLIIIQVVSTNMTKWIARKLLLLIELVSLWIRSLKKK